MPPTTRAVRAGLGHPARAAAGSRATPVPFGLVASGRSAPAAGGTGRGGLALVLGAGGHVGLAYHAGVLLSLQHHLGFDHSHAAVIVGTSAGSIVASLLRLGFTAEDLAAFVVNAPFSEKWRESEAHLRASFDQPHRRRLRNLLAAPSPAHLFGLAAASRRARPSVLLAGLLNGPVDIRGALSVFDQLSTAWPEDPLRLVAVRRDGRRAVFGGRDGTPELSSAVAASCAIPGVFAPVKIEGRSYIDGGVHSPSNADVLRDVRPDTVLVVSPMSAPPRSARGRLDAPLRRRHGRRLRRELAVLESLGATTAIVEPGPEELSVMPLNPMSRAGATALLREAFLATGDRILSGDLEMVRPTSPRAVD